LTGLLICTAVAAATAQPPVLPYMEERNGLEQIWSSRSSRAEMLMDSVLKVQEAQLQSPSASYIQGVQQTLPLYLEALKQYLSELPKVQLSRPMRQSWWQAFGRRQEHFWKRWQNRVDPLIRQDLELLWKTPHLRALEQTFPLDGLGRIAVVHEFGDLHLLGTAERVALFHADIEVISIDPQAAHQYADAIDIRTTTVDSTLRVVTWYPTERPATIDGVTVSIRLELPSECHLEIENGFGDVRAENFTGELKAHNRYGNITLQDCSGNLDVTNRHGAISITGGRGRLWAESSFQPITVSQFEGDVLAVNQFADISVDQAAGSVQMETSIGRIRASDIGDHVTVTNRLGQVMVQKVKGDLMLTNTDSRVLIADVLGETRIENHRGEIHAQQLGGNVVISNERGDVDLALNQIRENFYRLNSVFGVIRLNLPPNPSAQIQAEAQYGTIDSDFPLEIVQDGAVQFARGKLGQGMITIQLDAEHSSIYLISNGNRGKEVRQ
jgi:hypothetical protein